MPREALVWAWFGIFQLVDASCTLRAAAHTLSKSAGPPDRIECTYPDGRLGAWRVTTGSDRCSRGLTTEQRRPEVLTMAKSMMLPGFLFEEQS